MASGEKTRTVVVAGGTGALGKAVSLAFLAAGTRVIATYLSQPEYDVLANEAKAISATNFSGVKLDVTDDTAVARLINDTETRYGGIDALVVTIGGYAGGKRLWETDLKTFDKMINLNLRAAFVMARAVLPGMIRQKQGAIVNVASKAGYGHSGGAALYSASKAGALALFDSLADEVKDYNINVNSVVPSIMDTPANRKAMPKADFSKWPKTEDVAKVIVFLCSEEARLIQGAAVPVYGRT
ncbi:MAG TPA: SDR family oxidoreductase [Candidatus Acidoferrales bacterium]|nr:SDR family oxidoreductase [Candidatus Acidoferrales bacterium]